MNRNIRLLILIASAITAFPNVVLSSEKCMDDDQLKSWSKHDRQDKVISALQVFVNPAAQQEWHGSKHEMGDKTLSGKELDAYLDMVTDPEYKHAIEKKLKEKGVSDAAISKGASEMEEYANIKLKQRFNKILEKRNPFFIYNNPRDNIGYVIRELNGENCIDLELTSTQILNYESSRIPEWLSPSSAIAKAAASYRKARNFGTTFYGRVANGDTFIVLSKPRFGPKGPLPYHISGVVLIGDNSSNSQVNIFGDLMHVQYVIGPASAYRK